MVPYRWDGGSGQEEISILGRLCLRWRKMSPIINDMQRSRGRVDMTGKIMGREQNFVVILT